MVRKMVLMALAGVLMLSVFAGLAPQLSLADQADSALIFLHQRLLDPQTGRFISADSANPAGNTTGNRYSYAANEPVSKSDVTGLDPGISSADQLQEVARGRLPIDMNYFRMLIANGVPKDEINPTKAFFCCTLHDGVVVLRAAGVKDAYVAGNMTLEDPMKFADYLAKNGRPLQGESFDDVLKFAHENPDTRLIKVRTNFFSSVHESLLVVDNGQLYFITQGKKTVLSPDEYKKWVNDFYVNRLGWGEPEGWQFAPLIAPDAGVPSAVAPPLVGNAPEGVGGVPAPDERLPEVRTSGLRFRTSIATVGAIGAAAVGSYLVSASSAQAGGVDYQTPNADCYINGCPKLGSGRPRYW